MHLVFWAQKLLGNIKHKEGRESRQKRARRTKLELLERKHGQMQNLFKSAQIVKQRTSRGRSKKKKT